MENNKLFIPTKCKIGFNTRTDTYTRKLGYIIYNDGKVWKKEPSWLNWIENYISLEKFETEKLKRFNSDVSQATENYNNYKNSSKPSYGTYLWENIQRFKAIKNRHERI